MINLSKKKWKEFKIGEIFETKDNDGTQVPTGAYINKANLTEGKTPRITVTSQNNGVDGYWYTDDKNKREFFNFISVNFLGNSFYQKGKATLDMKVHALKLIDRELNENLALFLITAINNNTRDSSYGNQLSSTDLPRKSILLPVDENAKPDYKFMEDYIKEIETRKRKEYIQYCSETLEKLGGVTPYKQTPELNKVKWKEVFISDIFETIQRGKRLIRDNQESGSIPYISSSALNNGVDNFIGNTNKVRKFKKCLSLANSGSVGSCFYEPFEFIASDHVTHLKNTEYDEYTYIFLATMLNRLSNKYNFNREINDERIRREKILLPLNEKKEIDFNYMKQYVKNEMIKKYQTYLNYVKL